MASLSVDPPNPRKQRVLAGVAMAALHAALFLALSRAASGGERVEAPGVAIELWAPFPPAERPEPTLPQPDARPSLLPTTARPRALLQAAPVEPQAATSMAYVPASVSAASSDQPWSESALAAEASTSVAAAGAGQGGVASTGVGLRPAEDPYPGQVLAWIERHKRYPDRGRAAALEGAVVVAVTLDRRGRVRSVDLVRSSGHGVLDDAALSQVRDASPFPAAPADATWHRRRFEAPIVYRIRTART